MYTHCQKIGQLVYYDSGKDGKLFSESNPYIPKSCGSCPFARNKLKAPFADLAGKKDCYQCMNSKISIEVLENNADITKNLSNLLLLKGAKYNKNLKKFAR